MNSPAASIVRSILEAGLLAPSADNRHLLEFGLSRDTIFFRGSPEYRSAPAHRKVLSQISFGAVVENMTLRAKSLGYSAAVEWHLEDSESDRIASLCLSPATDRTVPALDSAIERRHTNRRIRFHGPRLGQDALAKLTNLAVQMSGVSLVFLDQTPARTKLLHLMTIAEAERFGNRSMHEELFGSIQFDVGWHRPAQTGLPPAALCVEPGLRRAFAMLRHWPIMNALRALGAHHLLALRAARLPCTLAPHLGVLTTDIPFPLGAALTGRVLQRVWLASETMGMAFQPFAAAAILALPEYDAVPPSLRTELRNGWRQLVAGSPVMVFRMGRAEAVTIRAGRPSLDRYLVPGAGDA